MVRSVADADLVARELADLPLALKQSVAAIRGGMSAGDFVQRVAEQGSAIFSHGAPPDYPTLAQTVIDAMRRLTSADQVAGQVLRICAFFAPTPVPLSILESAPVEVLAEPLREAVSSGKLRSSLDSIQSAGLADLTADTLQMYPLLQTLIRDSLDREAYTACRTLARALVSAGRRTAAAVPDSPDRVDLLNAHLVALGLSGADQITVNAVGHVLVGHTGPVTALAVVQLPDGGEALVSGSHDQTIRLWDVTTSQPLGEPYRAPQGA
jgi:hypothetical protein